MLQGDLGGVGGIIRAALGDPRTWMAGILFPFAKFGDDFIEHGRRIAAQNQQTRISFRVLMGDVQAADSLLRRLIDYAAHTPFELPQLFNVTQGLVAFGDRGDEVMRTLKMMGDVSGGVHEKFQILGTVYNQIRGEERLLSQDFKQLAIRGMLFITDIARYLGVTKAQAQRLQRAGRISFEDVRGTLMMLTQEGERFHNMMELQSQSIIGLTSTLKDSWGIFASKVAESLVPLDRVLIKIKIDLVNAMADLTESTDGFVAGMIIGTTAASKFALALLAVAAAARIMRISLRAALVGGAWGAVILGIGAALGGLIGWFSRSAEGIQAATDVSEKLRIVWRNLTQAAVELKNAINEGLVNAFGRDLAGVLDATSAKFADWARGIADWLIYISEMTLFASGGIAFAFRNAWDLLAIGGLDTFISLIDLLQRLQGVSIAVASTMMKVFAGAIAFIKASFDNLINNFKGIIQHLKDEWAETYELIKALTEGATWEEAVARGKAAQEKSAEEGFKKPADKSPLDEAIKAYEAEAGLSVDTPILDETKKALEEERQKLKERINERENKRKDAEPKLPGEEDKFGEGKRSSRPADALIATGRYGFIEFGRKIQDAMLKGNAENQTQQMIDLLGQGNGIQQRILEEQRNNRGLGP